jgi:hypothetical protein
MLICNQAAAVRGAVASNFAGNFQPKGDIALKLRDNAEKSSGKQFS